MEKQLQVKNEKSTKTKKEKARPTSSQSDSDQLHIRQQMDELKQRLECIDKGMLVVSFY